MVGRDTPSLVFGGQEDYRSLYYSEHLAARKVPVSIMAGFGTLKMGTAMAKNGSAGGSVGKLIPYDPTSVTGAEVAPVRAYLVQDSGIGASDLYVPLADAYKFAVGDDVYINDDTTTLEQLGAITAIDVTTYTHMAVITVTTVTGADSFTTARFAYLAVQGADTCVGILEKSVDCGTGTDAKGALATLIRGNCVLITGMLTNFDAAAIVDLSAGSWGKYTDIA